MKTPNVLFILMLSLTLLQPGYGQAKAKPAAAPPARAAESLPPFSSMSIVFCMSADAACLQPGAQMPFTVTNLTGVGSSTGHMAHQNGIPRGNRVTLDRMDNGIIELTIIETAGPGAGLTSKYVGTYKDRQVIGRASFVWPGHAEDGKTATWAGLIKEVQIQQPSTPTTHTSSPETLKPFSAADPESVDLPDPYAVTPPAPPSPRWSPATAVGPDLNGIWESEQGTPVTPKGLVQRVAIYEFRNTFLIVNLEGFKVVSPKDFFIIGTYSASPAFSVILRAVNDKQLYAWLNTNMRIVDPDTLYIADGLILHRTSRIERPDMPCDPANPSRITPEEAFYRGKIYNQIEDLTTGACWNYISAVQGYAPGQARYANQLRIGQGVMKNPQQAFLWAQRAAMQADILGELTLADMFSTGDAAPLSRQRHMYWQLRADEKDDRFTHTANYNPIPVWASRIAGPCDPSNPQSLDIREAFWRGMVAYQARAFQTAHCWFTINEKQGNPRATVFLSLMSMYGMGVPRNPEAGFAMMQKAAEAGDHFGINYLSYFYRDGFGTAPNRQIALFWSDKMAGDDSLEIIEGIWDPAGTQFSFGALVSSILTAEPFDPERDACKQRVMQENLKNYPDRYRIPDYSECNSMVTAVDRMKAETDANSRAQLFTLTHPEEIFPRLSYK